MQYQIISDNTHELTWWLSKGLDKRIRKRCSRISCNMDFYLSHQWYRPLLPTVKSTYITGCNRKHTKSKMNESWCINRFFQTHETEWGRSICVLVRLKRFGVSKWFFGEKRFAGDRDTGCRGASTGNHRARGSKWGTEWWHRIIEVGPGRSTKWTFRNDSVLQLYLPKKIDDVQSYTRRNVRCISHPTLQIKISATTFWRRFITYHYPR